MSLIIELKGSIGEISAMLKTLESKVAGTAKKIGNQTKKMNKEFEVSNKNLMMAGAAQMAFFWGVAQVSPVVNSMLEIMTASFGAIFDVIFSSLLPAFEPLMEVLWNFASWLQEQPEWVTQLIGVLILLAPAITMVVAAIKGMLALKAALVVFGKAAWANPIIIILAAIALAVLLLILYWDDVKAAFAKGAAWIREKLAWLIDPIMFLAGKIKEFYDKWIKPVVDAAVAAFKKLGEFVGNIYKKYFKAVFKVIKSAIGGIVKAVKFWWDRFKQFVDWAKGIYNKYFKPPIDMVVGAFKKVIDVLKTIWGWMKKIGDFFKDTFGGVMDGISGAADWVGGGIGKIGSALGFAEGGIVTRPTLGLVGEAGPEAIIPLKNGSVPMAFATQPTARSTSSESKTYNVSINIESPNIKSESDLDALVTELSKRLQIAMERMV